MTRIKWIALIYFKNTEINSPDWMENNAAIAADLTDFVLFHATSNVHSNLKPACSNEKRSWGNLQYIERLSSPIIWYNKIQSNCLHSDLVDIKYKIKNYI